MFSASSFSPFLCGCPSFFNPLLCAVIFWISLPLARTLLHSFIVLNPGFFFFTLYLLLVPYLSNKPHQGNSFLTDALIAFNCTCLNRFIFSIVMILVALREGNISLFPFHTINQNIATICHIYHYKAKVVNLFEAFT